MKRRILQIGLLLAFILMIVSVFKINSMYASAVLKDVHVTNNNDIRFVTDTHISDMIKGSKLVKNVPLKKVDLDSLENDLSKNKFLDDVDVVKTYSYRDGRMSGSVQVSLTQRRPIVRVKTRAGDYFMDKNGLRLDKPQFFTTDVLLATGNIDERFAKESIVPLVNTIGRSEFWSSQVCQIYVDDNKEIGLAMLYGRQLIVLGDTSGLDEKFDKLWAFYNDSVAVSNMGQYRMINLKYKGQIVCSK
ncbi:MAG: cell division protein FtsQ/DivIB [Bacteroidales bacterium]